MTHIISRHKSSPQSHKKSENIKGLCRKQALHCPQCPVYFWNQYIFGLDDEGDLALFALDKQKFAIASMILHQHQNIDYPKISLHLECVV